MKANYSKLLTNIAGILGITGVSLLINLPSGAIETNSQVSSNTNSKTQIAQGRGNGILNPNPSIFREFPYNRSTQPSVTPTPAPITPPSQTTSRNNVIEVAKSAGSFKTLLAALQAGGLTKVLEGSGPFTILAPTDEAFAKLPQDAVKDLLKPENKAILVKILTYHVVKGTVLSTDLKSGEVTSLQGDPIKVKVNPAQGVFVNDAQVTRADIPASNGVIHQIDTLILPPSL